MKKLMFFTLVLGIAFSNILNASVMTFILGKANNKVYYFWDSDLLNGANLSDIVNKNKLVPLDTSLAFAISDMLYQEFDCGQKEVKCDYELINDFVKEYNERVKVIKNLQKMTEN